MKKKIIQKVGKYTIESTEDPKLFKLRSNGIVIYIETSYLVKSMLKALLVVDELNDIKHGFMSALDNQITAIFDIALGREQPLELNSSNVSINKLDEISSNLNEIEIAINKFLNNVK